MRLAMLLTVVLLLAACASMPADDPNTLRVGTSANFPPIIFKRDGQLVGVEADLKDELSKALGRPMRFVEMDFDTLIPALQSGKIDLIMAGMSITADRRKLVAFATPYMRAGQLAAVRPADGGRYVSARAITLTQGAVGYERGTTAELVVTRSFARARGKAYASLAAATDALVRGDVDVLVGDGPSIVWLSRQRPEAVHIPDYSYLTQEQLAWAVRRDDTVLLDQLNATLERWRRDLTLLRMSDKWYGRMP